MKTISFVGNGLPPDKLLNLFKRQTPGNLGVWGNLQGVPTYDSDYHGVIDCLPANLRHLESKSIFLGAHPESMRVYQDMSSFKGIAMFDCKKTFGFGEWWLKYDYNYLNNLQPMIKSENLTCIMSDANSQSYHKVRRNYLEKFCNQWNVHLYGRIQPWGSLVNHYKGHCGSIKDSAEYYNDHMSGKEEIYASHKYALEFDATGKFYFSERIFDCLLMWCMPIYWGGESLHQFIPKESFRYLAIEGNGSDVIDIIESKTYEKSLPAIKEARRILLDELQMWPRIHHAIFGSYK